MEIKKIRLSNVGRFTDLEVAFAPTDTHASKVTVFVGNNGAGKTTILNSLATSLSWLVARIRSENGVGSPISEDLITNGVSTASIQIRLDEQEYFDGQIKSSQWTLAKSRKGRSSQVSSELLAATVLANYFRDLIDSLGDEASLPLVAYYPVERSVLNVPLRVKTRRPVDQFDGYDNALSRGVDFSRFFEWFREREDTENEVFTTEVFNKQQQLVETPDKEFSKKFIAIRKATRDPQLTAVRSAISAFMPGFKNLRVQRKPRLQMTIDKAGKTLNVEQLSQGEKSMMALVGDIARRLAIMNPSFEKPLEGNGVVLIDEVDLHLHPQWQRRLIHQLTETFPNCQFIVTTHSPLVISDSKDVLCYVLDDGELEQQNGLYGLDANQVLLGVMNTEVRNSHVQERLDRMFELLQDNHLKSAKALFQELFNELPSGHIELAKAALLIRKLEIRSA